MSKESLRRTKQKTHLRSFQEEKDSANPYASPCCIQDKKKRTPLIEAPLLKNAEFQVIAHVAFAITNGMGLCTWPCNLVLSALQHFPKTLSFLKTSHTQTQLGNHLSSGIVYRL